MILLRWYAVAVGTAAGVAVASLVAVLLWVGLAAIGVSDDLTGPVLVGVLVGLAFGGYIAGRLGARPPFQGGLAGLAVAAVVAAISIIGGSPAPVDRLVLLFGLGLVLGIAGGALAGRQRASYPEDVSSPGDRGPRSEESPDSTGQDAG